MWFKKSIQDFYPSVQSIGDAWSSRFTRLESRKTFSEEQRSILVDVLKSQYAGVETTALVESNINMLLSAETFTITTGQQMVTGMGPWMILHKLATAIHLAEKWKTEFPEQHFVPVFWMATEDHDWPEIAQIQSGNKRRSWTTVHTGAVGRMPCDETVDALLKWNEDFPSEAFPEEVIRIYKESSTLSGAYRQMVNHYFKESGLVVLDADDVRLKRSALSVFEQDALHSSLYKTAQRLGVASGEIEIKTCNLFSLENRQRLRLDPSQYEGLAKNAPGDISPNVALRIMYQEHILPNVVYVGGPSEQRYWKQVMTCMEEMQIPHAAFALRERGCVIPERLMQKWGEKGFDESAFQWNEKQLKDRLLAHWGELPLGSLGEKLSELYQEARESVQNEDPTLLASLEGELKKAQSGIEQIRAKIDRVRKRKDAENMQWVERWVEVVSPLNALQERSNYWLIAHHKKAIPFQEWLSMIDPMDPSFKIWIY